MLVSKVQSVLLFERSTPIILLFLPLLTRAQVKVYSAYIHSCSASRSFMCLSPDLYQVINFKRKLLQSNGIIFVILRLRTLNKSTRLLFVWSCGSLRTRTKVINTSSFTVVTLPAMIKISACNLYSEPT